VTRLDPTAASLASAIGALVRSDLDVADVLAHLVADCARDTSAAACALLALDGQGELSLLAAESHRAVELELFQIQRESGPCVDVIASGEALEVAGEDAMRQRWEAVGERIVSAGFGAVEAYPMRWRGVVLGGLNLFRGDAEAPAAGALGQAFADVATLVVVNGGALGADEVEARLHEALSARAVVEQAKGVLAYREDVDLGTAYELLLRRAESAATPLTRTALDVVAEASSRDRTT
jgi:hypothetical protein